jgi:hypothetical protein
MEKRRATPCKTHSGFASHPGRGATERGAESFPVCLGILHPSRMPEAHRFRCSPGRSRIGTTQHARHVLRHGRSTSKDAGKEYSIIAHSSALIPHGIGDLIVTMPSGKSGVRYRYPDVWGSHEPNPEYVERGDVVAGWGGCNASRQTPARHVALCDSAGPVSGRSEYPACRLSEGWSADRRQRRRNHNQPPAASPAVDTHNSLKKRRNLFPRGQHIGRNAGASLRTKDRSRGLCVLCVLCGERSPATENAESTKKRTKCRMLLDRLCASLGSPRSLARSPSPSG